jgi:molecular chaperone DnaJ
VSSAYETLGDPKKRALYDEFGDVATRSGFDEEKARKMREYQRQAADAGARGDPFGGSGFDPGDLGSMFGDFFSQRESARARRHRAEEEEQELAGADAESELQIELRDAVLGAEREISVRKPVRCAECHGTGVQTGSRPRSCPDCNGTGELRQGRARRMCPRCRGEGQLRDPCVRCGGEGQVEDLVRLKVRIPAGVETGSRVRLPGQGAPARRGGQTGDLYLRIVVRPHPRVRVDGHDLTLDLPVTVGEALAGGEVTAPTFEGPVTLKIPPGSQSGRKLRLRGRGLPDLKSDKSDKAQPHRGDLYVVLQVQVPPDSPEARAAAEELRKLYPHDVRRDVAL